GVSFADGFSAANFTNVTASSKMTFAAGATYTISGTLNLNGQATGTKIVLVSSTPSTRYTFDVTGGAQSVSFVDVTDSNASTNDITANNSTGSGQNNDNAETSPFWIFPANASTAISEISPNSIYIDSTSNSFVYDFSPTIGGSDTGVDVLTITAPSGYSNLAITAVSVGGGGQTLGGSCPSVGAGEYCTNITGQVMTITLGTKVTVDATNIKVSFNADAPTLAGSNDFTASVDDSGTGAAAETTTAGNADSDAGDNNSISVNVIGYAVSTAVAEISPNSILVGSNATSFVYDILPTISPTNTGVNEIKITAPTNYSALTVNGVSVGGGGQTAGASCPSLAAGEYCAVVAGQDMTITLGTKLTIDATNIQISFSADAPSTVSSADFVSTLDDTSTAPLAAQSTTAGNADADASDNNSVSVSVKDSLSEPDSYTKIYWVDAGAADSLKRADISGSNVETLATALSNPRGLEVDETNGKIYWSQNGTSEIKRSNLDGSVIEVVANTAGEGFTNPFGVDVDAVEGKVYWVSTGVPLVQKKNLDGSGSATLIDTGSPDVVDPQDVAVDNAGGKVYWINNGNQDIRRKNITGSGTVDVLVTGLTTPRSIALDIAAGEMYFVDAGAGTINKHNMDGSASTTVILSGLTSPQALALDVSAGKMYWSDTTDDKIYRRNMDGSGSTEIVIDSGLDTVRAISLGYSGTGVVNPAVTSVVAEVSPNSLVKNSSGNAISVDVLAAIGGSDTGINRIVITAPSAYSNFSFNSVTVGGAGQSASASCPSVGAGEYCASSSGQNLVVTLGTTLTVDATNININFNADAPATTGSAAFAISVEDRNSSYALQTATAGNADADGADSNSLTVSITSLNLTGRVFEDADYNGIPEQWDGGTLDNGLENVTVELYNTSNSLIDTTISDANGLFTFANLENATYKVHVVSSTIADADTIPHGGYNACVPATCDYPIPEMVWAQSAAYLGGISKIISDITAAVPGDTTYPVTLSGADVFGINLGFAYNAIVNTNDAGQGSYRQFILNANAIDEIAATTANTSMFDTSVFIPGSPATIAFASTAPDITQDAVTVDASNAGVIIDGTSAGASAVGVLINSNNNIIRGLQVSNFSSHGIYIVTGTNNIIGGDNTSGSGPYGQGNRLSENTGSGIRMDSASNTIYGNYIGNDGNTAFANASHGIYLVGTADATIIGANTSAGYRNIISGNAGSGIYLNSADNVVIKNNMIGLGSDGLTIIANDVNGITSNGWANANTIGGVIGTDSNVISGNGNYGISFSGDGTSGTVVSGNYIGTDSTGSIAKGNGSDGIHISGGSNGIDIGGNATNLRNIISANGGDGINIIDTNSNNNTVRGNYIGTDVNGNLDLGNISAGIYLQNGASSNIIGGTTVGERNIISANDWHGIVLQGVGTDGNIVLGNYIGTNAAGTTALGNTFSGIGLSASPANNRIGGTSTADANIIAGNSSQGIRHDDGLGTLVYGNFIGVNASLMSIPNGTHGIEVSGGTMTIGNISEAQNNVIGVQTGNGLHLNAGNITLAGTIDINDTINLISGNIDLAASTINLSSDWMNSTASVVAGTSNVNLDGNSLQTITSSSSDFYNIVISNASVAGVNFLDSFSTNNFVNSTASSKMTFAAGATYTVNGSLSLNGQATGTEIQLVSSTPGTPYVLNVATAQSVYFVDVSDSHADNQNITAFASLNSGGNDDLDLIPHWIFQAALIVLNNNDSGVGSLRQVMTDAVANDTVLFDTSIFNPAAPATITLASALPILDNGSITIEASNAGVILDGNTTVANCLSVQSNNNIIRGLRIQNCTQYGIVIALGAEFNTIGGDSSLGSAASGQGNILVSNGWDGLHIQGNFNNASGNFIGTDENSSAAIGNSRHGVWITGGANYNTIGGNSVGERNIISGNASNGVMINLAGSDNNTIIGNYIGTNVSGSAALANNIGVVLSSESSSNIIGGSNATARNIISGNISQGVSISGAHGNSIQGNYIGVDATQSFAIANQSSGIIIGGTSANNIIGGTVAGAGNVISGNTGRGIWHSNGVDTLIQGNYIGVSSTLTEISNTSHGMQMQDGTATLGFNSEVQNNIFGVNGVLGLYVNGTGTLTLAGTVESLGHVQVNAGTLDLADSLFKVASHWTYVAGTIITGTSTVEFNGNASQIITTASTDFYNVVVSNADVLGVR
ncbi:MAG: hypothetical protein OEZ58_12235, partial [Gammaproteobacteria bacterium]|nr:hypothetical protein [Gammaproteobacteria bacterium]